MATRKATRMTTEGDGLERVMYIDAVCWEVAQLEAIDVLVQSEVLKFDSTRWYELPG